MVNSKPWCNSKEAISYISINSYLDMRIDIPHLENTVYQLPFFLNHKVIMENNNYLHYQDLIVRKERKKLNSETTSYN